MATHSPLQGRRSECEALDGLLEAVRGGGSRVLVVRGEPGVGKSALLEYLVGQASGCRVARAAGVQSEMELPFAGLHQLCAPMLDRLDRLPGPQRDALSVALGLTAGAAPDRFLVGLALLGLLSEVAEQRPLVCVVDDGQWLDRSSAQALEFVAHRVLAESVALLFAVRQSGEEEPLPGLPELAVHGLRNGDARALLGSVIRWPLDDHVRDRIIAETHGNPLALLELPRGLTPAELAGGFGPPVALTLPGRIEESFLRRLRELPTETRRLLLVAAAEPVGEPTLVWRAAERLGIGVGSADAAESEGLVEFGARVTFRHPLVRSAINRAASPQDRRDVHRALADGTDPELDPDRKAWHLAQATSGPDEDVASELERSAGRAQARGGLAAAAAFLERSAALTPEPSRRAPRALAAAQAKHQAGAPDVALQLLITAETGSLDALQRARMDLLRAQIAFTSSSGGDAPPLLLSAAKQLEPLDIDLARETYLDVLCATVYVGPVESGCDPLEVAQAALAAARPGPQRAIDLLLHGLALRITEGYATAAPAIRRALSAFDRDDLSAGEGLGWGWLACYIASTLWEHETQYALATRHVQLARDTGALVMLPHTLAQLVGIHLRDGELATAAALMQEVDAGMVATGSGPSPDLALSLAAYRGREAEARALIEARKKLVGGGIALVVVQWASALLYNGLGRYEDALRSGLQAHHDAEPVGKPPWILPELIEAAAGSGVPEEAAESMRRLSEETHVSGTDWALGLEARSRALLSDGEEAERLYREAIGRLAGPGSRVDLARAHLLYGEWLRREGRRTDARERLRAAHEMFATMGAEGFAERAERELLAAGETTRKRVAETSGQLTPQEAQVAGLARDGLSNAEIGARLFISPRTVQYHLRKVFAKLGINSRMHLGRVLPHGRNV
jgi:DNA-binding CsgD family transcriptional regulator/tetratricopeptide (TPR) repeat protein